MFYTFSNALFVQHVPQDLQDAVEAIQPGYYSRNNAAAWIQPNVFLPWLSNMMMGQVALQRGTQITSSTYTMAATTPGLPPTRPTPILHSRASPALSQTSSVYSLASSTSSWSTPTHSTAQMGKWQQIDPITPLVLDWPQESKKRSIFMDSDDDPVEISLDNDVAVPRYVLTPLKK